MAASRLPAGKTTALKAKIATIMEEEIGKRPMSNLTKEEMKAMKELKENEDIIIVPADKGRCIVVMDRNEYERKMLEKLGDDTTYKEIDQDPTMEIQGKLVEQLKQMKETGELNEVEYRKLYPNQTQVPRIYGQPKIHKEGYPLREIVDASGSVARDINKSIANIIKKYAREAKFCLKDSEQFVDKMKDEKLEEDEDMASFDVVALFPSVPQEEAMEIVYELMNEDIDLEKRTKWKPDSIMKLMKICVSTTYFTFRGKIYQQVDGLAIGAPTSGFLADIFMYRLEMRALNTFAMAPRVWERFVDDIYAVIKKILKERFLEHLNSLHPRIKFTKEDAKDNKLPFLDTEVKMREEDRRLEFSIYRKPTHTDQYLAFDSNHHVSQKLGIVHTLNRRRDRLVTTQESKEKEGRHIRNALRRCSYPQWAVNKRIRPKEKQENEERKDYEWPVVIPYVKKISERMARVYKRFGLRTVHKPTRTLKSAVCNMKEKIHEMDRVDAVYEVECKEHGVRYVGETKRPLKARAVEHRVIKEKDARKSWTLGDAGEKEKEEVEESTQGRRSKRLEKKEKKDYKTMDKGDKLILTEGSTEPAKHAYEAQAEHKEGSMVMRALCYEKDFWKRGVREAIEIHRRKPQLNQDLGRSNLFPMFRDLITKEETLNSAKKEGQTTEKEESKAENRNRRKRENTQIFISSRNSLI